MKRLLLAGLCLLAGVTLLLVITGEEKKETVEADLQMQDPVSTKIARSQHYFRLLRDPAQDAIPANIRSRELNYSKTLPERDRLSLKMKAAGSSSHELTWSSAGPDDVGGRTRALGIDRRNSDIIIAGGASGGIWKSEDGGSTWQLKTDASQNMSVTSLAQDPTNPDTWYYASGEYRGNSASDRGFRAYYYGAGIFKSTDNGNTWTQIASTVDEDNSWNGPFDYISKIVISPVTGSVFLASNGFGIYRSTDGETFSLVKGGAGNHLYTEVDVASDGTLMAVLSSVDAGNSGNEPGLFVSADDGDSWTEVTPSSFPSVHQRSLAAFAPSEPDKLYVLTYVSGSDDNEDVRFFYLDLANGSSEDRSDNIPDFGGHTGYMDTQGNYNMALAVKPDNADFVLIGGTNLFRSTDGFASSPAGGYDNSNTAQKDAYWIGGYTKANNSYGSYPNHHADQHVLAFDPANPNILWSGHDGAISVTQDITASSVSWDDKDKGYITSQFYTVAIPSSASDNRIMGGTQDNGTPFFRIDNQFSQTSVSTDVSSGDGSYAFFGNDYLFLSTQNGRVVRYGTDENGDQDPYDWAHVYPSGASSKLFIHPYAIDPNDETIMYYPDGRVMWRNTAVDEIPLYTSGGTTTGWESYSAVSTSGYQITALKVSVNPSNILYYGASSYSGAPKLFKVAGADTSDTPTEISIPEAADGAYLHDIAVNPEDADEVIAVMSNYNIVGLYHTTNGGRTWEAIEGNLEGDQSAPGPSVRSATIFPSAGGKMYLVGTSTGVYSTETINGSSTQWVHEATASIGYAVSEYIVSRPADGVVAVGTHGRGIFMGSASQTGPDSEDVTPPATPQNPVITQADSGIELSWSANTENDVARYRIYRGGDLKAMVVYDSVDAGTTSFKDTLSDGPAFYAVTAIDVSDNESGLSDGVGIYNRQVEVASEWSLMSSPVTSAEEIVLPGNVQLVNFGGSYQIVGQIEPQKGYWIKGDKSSSISITGKAVTNASISLRKGWNLIGGIADTVATSAITDSEGILSSAPVYEYAGGSYSQTTGISPLQGYWMHANQSGTIQLSAEAAQKSKTGSGDSSRTNKMKKPEEVIVFSRQGVRQLLYVASESLQEDERQLFLLPPPSPSPFLDVRTKSNTRVIEHDRSELVISARSFPVRVSVEGGNNTKQHLYRLEAVNGADTVYHDIHPGSDALLMQSYERVWVTKLTEDEAGLEFKLHHNYPNPFREITTIRYEVASGERVQLDVYNILGRKIKTLVDSYQEPGIYTVSFNGNGLSSGTYFIRLKTNQFSQTQKMTLLR